MATTFTTLSSMAAQLATTPDDPALLQKVYREFHRIHGTAGSYGYRSVSQLARTMEHQVHDWIKNDSASPPDRDITGRGQTLEQFVEQLRAAFDADEPNAGAALEANHLGRTPPRSSIP